MIPIKDKYKIPVLLITQAHAASVAASIPHAVDNEFQ